MRIPFWKHLIALIAMVVLLQAPVAAQGVGGDYKDAGDDSGDQTSDINGPCVASDRDDVTDPEEAGLAGPRAYESPQFGYAIDWSRDWILDDYFETPVLSSLANEQDSLCLFLNDDTIYSYMYVIGQANGRGGADADVDEWVGKAYIANQWAPKDYDVTVLLDDVIRDRGSVVYEVVFKETEEVFYTTYLSVGLDDGSTLYVTLLADENSFEDAYAIAQDGVMLDDEPIFTVFDWQDIEAEL